MKLHAEPKPLHEPLAGGTQGATVIVEPMIAGTVNWPLPLMESPGGRFLDLRLARHVFTGKPPNRVPCPAFLIRHPSAGAILVDTGLHPSISTDPRENFGSLGARFASPELGQGEDVASQLREKGVPPAQVAVVVMTHLHYDHASAISEFPESTFIITDAEWEAASTDRRPALRGYRHAHYDWAFDYRTVDMTRGGVASYATFGRAFDLFGDGSIHLAYTPGHSAGHVSVIARLAQRDFVIGGDAIYTMRQLEPGAALPPKPVDDHRYRRSLQELRLFRREYPNAIITPGHDASFYAQLEDRYE